MRARLLSLAIHLGVIALLLVVSSETAGTHRAKATDPRISSYVSRLVSPATHHGGGGGGERSPMPAGRGHLPKAARRQFTPPTLVARETKPLLPVEPTLVMPADAPVPVVNLTQFGEPYGRDGPASGGPGRNGGIGEGDHGGVGNHSGPGFGDDDGGGFSSLAMTGTLTAPTVLYRIEPEFSEEARKAKYQGTVVLTIEIGEDGKPRRFRILRSLGLGLDEKAIEAVSRWKFRPARRNGKPVPAPATVEVNFRLL